MGKPLNRGTEVEITAGTFKGAKGTYLYHCCSGYKIRFTDGDTIFLHDRRHFRAAKEPKTKE